MQKICMAIVLTFLLAGLPVSGFSESIYQEDFDAKGFYVDFLDFGTVSDGSFSLTLDDISVQNPGFQGLVLILSTGINSSLGNILFLNQDQTHDSLFFDLDAEAALTATVFGFTSISTGSTISSFISNLPCCFETSAFSVQLSSVPIPSAVLLLGTGLIALVTVQRRKKY